MRARLAAATAPADTFTPGRRSRSSRDEGLVQVDVLLVEDDADLRAVIESELGDRGYRVAVAAQGKDALEALDRVRPSVILLDILMPVMNGWDFLRALRCDPDHADTPVVAITWLRHTPLPVSATLTKPLQLDKLLAMVATFVPRA